MSTSYLERERKFEVDSSFVVPDVVSAVPGVHRAEKRTEQLRSEYYDTPDHALLRARMTLRRRTGTTDSGWQLKVPAGEFREEVRIPDAEDDVPQELRTLLLGVGAGRPLVPIARLATERSVTRLLDERGALLAEIDDDTVHASAGGVSATVSAWREVEVELGDAAGADELDLLRALGKQLRRAGARESGSSSKLSRALREPRKDRATKRANAGAIIGSFIADQQRQILAGDVALRRGDDQVIHKTRVATRRLRSTLRVFELFDADRARALDSELRWYAGLLGEVRDLQVLRDRMRTLVDGLDPALLLGPVRARIDADLAGAQLRAWDVLQQELSAPRYLAMLAEINDWVLHPPTRKTADAPGTALEPLVARAERKVTKRLKAANSSRDVEHLHRARKAAKRARYAAEAAEPVLGHKRSHRHAKRYRWLQDLLGEHQDALMGAVVLRRLGAAAGTSGGENGFAFGILHEREERAAREVRRKARHAAARY